MSEFDDLEGVIAAEIHYEVVEELIRGAFEPELPTELVSVGRVLRAAHGPIPGEDRAREVEVVEAMIAAMSVTSIAAARPSTRTRRRALVAVTAAVSVLSIGGVAAAAGGLPASIQSFVHDSLSHVGVSVPTTEDEPSSPELEATNSTSDLAPGQSGDTPGQSGSTPGLSGSEPPGQSGDTPGQSGNTPGLSGSEPPGQSDMTPGLSGDAPGQSDKKPEDSGKVPDDPEITHGQSDK